MRRGRQKLKSELNGEGLRDREWHLVQSFGAWHPA